MMRLKISEKGFTLIELLVVILIIGILLAIAAPSFLGQQTKAQDSAAEQALTVGYKEIRAYWSTTQAFSTSAALTSALQSGEPQTSWTSSQSPPCPAMPSVSVNVVSASQATLCTNSASGNNVLLLVSPGTAADRVGVIGSSSSSYTNLVPDPSFENTTANLVVNHFTASASTTQALFGQYGVKLTGDGSVASASQLVPVSAGTTYQVMTHVYATTASHTNVDSVTWYSDWPTCSASVSNAQFNKPTVVGSWTTFTATVTAPATATCARVYGAFLATPAAGEVNYVDGVMFTPSNSSLSYFDGNLPGGNWTGTANNSASTDWSGQSW